jgi:hypothetical protein
LQVDDISFDIAAGGFGEVGESGARGNRSQRCAVIGLLEPFAQSRAAKLFSTASASMVIWGLRDS